MSSFEYDLRRAIEAAYEAGARTPREISAYVRARLEPMLHAENLTTAADLAVGRVNFALTIVRPTGSEH